MEKQKINFKDLNWKIKLSVVAGWIFLAELIINFLIGYWIGVMT